MKKYCMEVDFGENADSADVFGRVLGFRGTVFPLAEGTVPRFRWGHSPGGRVDDEAVGADGEGETSRK